MTGDKDGGVTLQWEEPEDNDPLTWIREPTDTHHGLRVVDHDGTVFIEQVDNEGEERQSIMVGATDFVEVERMAAAFERVVDRYGP